MEVTVSDKYQVVIPKAARKKLGIKPGQKITIKRVSPTSITFERSRTMEELIEQSKGILTNAPWDKEGIDPAVWLRRERDKE
ncbi:MAG: AbrB/MazE/SpoVT family DNA-binding domain-containing protein [Candidatus Saccharimonadales bacterium]